MLPDTVSDQPGTFVDAEESPGHAESGIVCFGRFFVIQDIIESAKLVA